MADRPSAYELWMEAGEDRARYRELLRQHGHLLSPGDEGYEQASATLPCGWPGPRKPEAWCEFSELPKASCSHCTGRGEEIPAVAGPAGPGLWITAKYGGSCAGCGSDVAPGDRIRSDGDNGWLCADCGGGQ